MVRTKALEIRLGILQAASFVSIGVYLPFFPLWLSAKGLSPEIIGIVVALPIIVRILVSAPLMGLADRAFGVRRLLLASHVGQIIGFALLLFVEDAILMAVLVSLLAVGQAAVIPGNDLVSTNAVQAHPGLNYGRIRGFGSTAFFVTNIAMGYLIGAYGTGTVIVVLTLVPFLAIAATLMAVPTDIESVPTRAEQSDAGSPRLPAALWLAMFAGAMIQACHGALYAFGSIHWQALGFSDAVIGYFWAIGVIAEILVFIVLGRAVGRGAGLGLLLFGAAGAVVRFTLLSLSPGMAATLVIQLMHSLSFGATHLGTMAALTALAPRHARGRAQGIYGSLAALMMAGSTMVSGMIYKEGGAAVFAAMAPLGAIGFVLILVAGYLLKAQPQRAGSGG